MSEKKDITRAEEVRLRREKESTQRKQRAVRHATRSMPPVTTRGRQTPTTSRRRKAQNARRRFQIVLPIRSAFHVHASGCARFRSFLLQYLVLHCILPITFPTSA
jgi:hypothetical protein